MNRIYNEVAKKYNVTPEEVEREIAEAVRQARENPSPTARAFWSQLDEGAEIDEIIKHIIKTISIAIK